MEVLEMVPLAVAPFLMVWVCSHAINVLIILSPFSTLDALVKLMRTGLLVVVGLAHLITPWLATVFCVTIIAVAAWLAPSVLRLAIFEARYAADILLPGRGRKRATPEQLHAFTLFLLKPFQALNVGLDMGLPPYCTCFNELGNITARLKLL